MQTLDEYAFETELVREYSSGGQTKLGVHHNLMRLRVKPNGDNPPTYGDIIWNFGKAAADEDEEVIGLWFEGKMVTDYDGVFELPHEALTLLKRNGFDTSEVEA